MQFLDWLDRHFTSNSHFYFYADELGWPMDCYPYDPSGEPIHPGSSQARTTEDQKPAETH